MFHSGPLRESSFAEKMSNGKETFGVYYYSCLLEVLERGTTRTQVHVPRRESIVRAIAACAANGHPASTRRLALLMLVRAQFLAQRTKRLLERTDAAAAHMCALPSARRRTPPRCCAWRRRETGRVVRAERECECTHVEGVCNPIPGARARGVTQHVQHGAQWIERVVQGVCVLRVEMFNT